MSPDEVLAVARDLVGRADSYSSGLWPRAAALLARQALEMSLDELWSRKAPGLRECTTSAQLLCLSSFIDDEGLAKRAALTWKALSRACHQHAYELAPSGAELRAWLDSVAAVVSAGTRDDKARDGRIPSFGRTHDGVP